MTISTLSPFMAPPPAECPPTPIFTVRRSRPRRPGAPSVRQHGREHQRGAGMTVQDRTQDGTRGGTGNATDDGPVGLVIAGAGARGAYEMGALSVLLPWLRSRGETPRIEVGTSAGAMNAVLVAEALEAGDHACTAGLDVWGGIGRASVFEPLLPTSVRSGLR